MDKKDLLLETTNSQWVSNIKSFVPAIYLPNTTLKQVNGKIVKEEVIKEIDNINQYQLINNNKKLFFSGYKKENDRLIVYLTESLTEISPEEVKFYYYPLSKNQVIEKLNEKLNTKDYDKKQSVLWKFQWYMKTQGNELIKWYINKTDPLLLVSNINVYISHKRFEFDYGLPPISTKKTENIYLYFKYLKALKSVKIKVKLKGKDKDRDDNKDSKDNTKGTTGDGFGFWIFLGLLAFLFSLISSLLKKCASGEKPDISELIEYIKSKMNTFLKQSSTELSDYLNSIIAVATEDALDEYSKLYEIKFKEIAQEKINLWVQNKYNNDTIFDTILEKNSKIIISDNIKATGSGAFNEILTKIKGKLNDDICKKTVKEVFSKISNINENEILNNINEKFKAIKPELIGKAKLVASNSFDEILDIAKGAIVKNIKEFIKEKIIDCNQKHIDEIMEELEQKLPNLVKSELKEFLQLTKTSFLLKIDFSQADELSNNEKQLILNDNSNEIVNQFIITKLKKINFDSLAKKSINLIMLDMVKNELEKNIVKSEHILIKSNYEGIFNNWIEKIYYISYLKKNLKIKVNNLNKNVSAITLEKLNFYLNQKLLNLWLKEQIYKDWLDNNFEKNIKKLLNEKLQNQIIIDNNSHYFDVNNFAIEVKKPEVNKNLLLELTHSELIDKKINVKINIF